MILHKKYLFIIFILISLFLGYGILQMRLSIYRVEGTSMIPTYHENDLLLVSQVPINEIKPLDVIAFSPISWQLFKFPLPLVCHRVITISYRNGSTWYATKGDNNILLDPPSPYISIVGKVILRIPFSILLIFLVNLLVALISVYLCKRLQTNVTNNKNRPSLYIAFDMPRLSVTHLKEIFNQVKLRFLDVLLSFFRQKTNHTSTYLLIPRPRPTNTLRPL